MKDIIKANFENLKLRQIVKDLTDNLISMETEIELKDSRIEYLEDTVTKLKAHMELESSPTDEIRLKS